MKISLGSWAFSFGPYADNPIPFDKTAKRLSEAGYDGIEICGFPPHITLEEYPDKKSRNGVRRSWRPQARRLRVRRGFLGHEPGGCGAARSTSICSGRTCRCAWISAARRSVWTRWPRRTRFPKANAKRPSRDSRRYGARRRASRRMPASGWCGSSSRASRSTSHRSRRHARDGGAPEFLRHVRHFARLHVRGGGRAAARSEGDAAGRRARVPDEARWPHRRDPPDRFRRHAARRRDQHAPPVRRRLHRLRRPDPRSLLKVPGIEWWCIDLCFWAGSWEIVEPSLQFVRRLLAAQVALADGEEPALSRHRNRSNPAIPEKENPTQGWRVRPFWAALTPRNGGRESFVCRRMHKATATEDRVQPFNVADNLALFRPWGTRRLSPSPGATLTPSGRSDIHSSCWLMRG